MQAPPEAVFIVHSFGIERKSPRKNIVPYARVERGSFAFKAATPRVHTELPHALCFESVV